MPHEVTIRPFASRADYDACVQLQREIWGERFVDVVPATILMVSQRVGGVSAGAFDTAGRLLGFVFGISGIRDREPVHWSDMLAVRPEARGAGLGKRLKLYQRDRLLEQGIRRVLWTYDPLVARNANLNLNCLRARPVEYVVNLYGDTRSALHAGLDTDRFIVEWRLDDAGEAENAPLRAPRATTARPASDSGNAPGRAAVPGNPPAGTAGARSTPAVAMNAGDEQTATAARSVSALATDPATGPAVDLAWSAAESPLPTDARVRVAAPADIDAIKAADPARACAWQQTQRRAFTWYLANGYRVSGFEHHPAPDDSHYLVTRGSASTPSGQPDSGPGAAAAPADR